MVSQNNSYWYTTNINPIPNPKSHVCNTAIYTHERDVCLYVHQSCPNEKTRDDQGNSQPL